MSVNLKRNKNVLQYIFKSQIFLVWRKNFWSPWYYNTSPNVIHFPPNHLLSTRTTYSFSITIFCNLPSRSSCYITIFSNITVFCNLLDWIEIRIVMWQLTHFRVPLLVHSSTWPGCGINISYLAVYISCQPVSPYWKDWGLLPLTGWWITHFTENHIFYRTPTPQVWIKSTLFLLISLIYKAVYLAIAEKVRFIAK